MSGENGFEAASASCTGPGVVRMLVGVGEKCFSVELSADMARRLATRLNAEAYVADNLEYIGAKAKECKEEVTEEWRWISEMR